MKTRSFILTFFLLISLCSTKVSAQSLPSEEIIESLPTESAPTSSETSEEVLGTIQAVNFQGLHDIDAVLVADVNGMERGESFTYRKLENSINTLKRWGVFSKVDVLVEYEDDEVTLNYLLEEGFIIKDITIHGNYPLLEGAARRSLFLNAGQIYDPSKLPDQIDRLDKLYNKEGYFDNSVIALEDYNEAKREVTLKFYIQKGKTYYIRNANIKGNTALYPRRVRTIIFTYSHYKPRKIKRDMEKIRELYRDKGYVRARVRLEGENFDEEMHQVDLDLAMRQGKRIFVKFEGNDHFFDRTLKEQITLYEEGDFDDYELDASRHKLINFYKLRGYEDVAVQYAREKLNDDEYLITFKIAEGHSRRIKKIKFEGNQNIDDDRLHELILSKENAIGEEGYYFQPLLDQDLKLIEELYKSEGFLDVQVGQWKKEYNEFGDKVLLTLKIDEKPRAIVENFKVEGLETLNAEQQARILRGMVIAPGRAYSSTHLEQDLQVMAARLANRGYPYAKIDREVQNTHDHFWDVKIKVNLGTQVKIGHVLIVGNSLTRESTIRKNLRFKGGDLFSATRLLQSQINLRKLGIFDGVNIEALGLANQEETVHVRIQLQEKKSKITDLEFGYNTDSGFNGKLVFNKLNMWGSGKNGNVKLQLGQEVSRLELNYIDPRLRGSSLQLLIGTYAGFERRPFFQNFSTGAYGTLFKDFSQHLSLYGRLGFEYVNFNESRTVLSVLRPNGLTEDRTRLNTTVGMTYDHRDNFGNPRKGYFLNGEAKLTNQFIQKDGSYITLHGSAGYWYSPFSRITFANALRGSKTFTLPKSTEVPIDDRLYLGGDDTVRGFDQDALLPPGGLFSLVHNFEMQFHLFSGFQLVGFLDTGVAVREMEQISLATLRHSIGPGLRYQTPVGPIRLEYGFKLDRQPGESPGRLHFSFGYFF